MMRSIALCGLLAASAVQAGTFTVVAGHSRVEFDEATATPVRWELCQALCEQDGARGAVLFEPGDGRFGLDDAPASEVWSVERIDSPTDVLVRFRSAERTFTYRFVKATAEVYLRVPGPSELTLSTGQVFVPEPLPGFGAIYTRVQAAQVSADGQVIHAYDDPDRPAELSTGDAAWAGVRSRYWAFLMRPAADDSQAPGSGTTAVRLDYAAENRPLLRWTGAADAASSTVRIYAGPVEWHALRTVAPELSEMLFAALWDFLRALTFGMMMLYGAIQSAVGNHGLAIVLLSLSVKILMTPITLLADRWQRDVNRIQSLLQPELDEIRRNYRGEEAHEKTLAVYRRHNVSMFYTFKSAAGFLIQIPVFIAAFDMLAENIALNEVRFLWIDNLARPDGFAVLPIALPFFGAALNLLPFLMTGLSTLAAWLQADDTLTPELQRQQSIRLYGMAGAFFLLFYTFPAGMVLYWTSSNLFHLLKVESGRLLAWLPGVGSRAD